MTEPKQTRLTPAYRMGQVVPFPLAAPSATMSSTPGCSGLTFTWEALERQLSELAVTPTQRGLVQTLISATRKQAGFKPAELVLREVLCIASVLMDETFHPDPTQPRVGEGGMT